MERHWIEELNQLLYFNDVLTSDWKSGHVSYWGKVIAFFSTVKKKTAMDTIIIDKDSI